MRIIQNEVGICSMCKVGLLYVKFVYLEFCNMVIGKNMSLLFSDTSILSISASHYLYTQYALSLG